MKTSFQVRCENSRFVRWFSKKDSCVSKKCKNNLFNFLDVQENSTYPNSIIRFVWKKKCLFLNLSQIKPTSYCMYSIVRHCSYKVVIVHKTVRTLLHPSYWECSEATYTNIIKSWVKQALGACTLWRETSNTASLRSSCLFWRWRPIRLCHTCR